MLEKSAYRRIRHRVCGAEGRGGAALLALLIAFLLHASVSRADIVDAAGRPLPAVLQIVKMFEPSIRADRRLYDEKGNAPVVLAHPDRATAVDVNKVAQAVFLRPRGAERTDAASVQYYKKLTQSLDASQRRALKNLFSQLGDVAAVYPNGNDFDYVLIHGSTVPNMRERVAVFANAVKTGRVRLKDSGQIVFLDGERPLFPTETSEVLLNPAPYPKRPGWTFEGPLPTTESDAAALVWDQLDLPFILRRSSLIFVRAKKKPQATRATTEDCVNQWIHDYHPRAGSALVVSNNPFVYYQRIVTQAVLNDIDAPDITLDSLGSGAVLHDPPTDAEIGVLLDNLARSFYTYILDDQ